MILGIWQNMQGMVAGSLVVDWTVVFVLWSNARELRVREHLR